MKLVENIEKDHLTQEEVNSTRPVEREIQTTWKSTGGGMLTIIAGSWNLLIGIGAIAGSADPFGPIYRSIAVGGVLGVGIGTFLVILGIISIVGGYFAIRKKRWALALVGGICATLPVAVTADIIVFLMATVALVFITTGRTEFGR
jgi:hypothetical protein